jgi:hypothetical protein
MQNSRATHVIEIADRNLALDIGDALPLATDMSWGVWRLSSEQRNALALSIVQQLKVCGWAFSRAEVWQQPMPVALKPEELNASNDG